VRSKIPAPTTPGPLLVVIERERIEAEIFESTVFGGTNNRFAVWPGDYPIDEARSSGRSWMEELQTAAEIVEARGGLDI